MKGSRNEMSKQNKQGVTKKPVPEIRDNLDSRSDEEFNTREDMAKSKPRKKDKSEQPKRS
jgi:hypothetical protein